MSIVQRRRLQGRPTSGDGIVGRDRLVEAARSVLRLRPTPDLSRKAVADAAGVTPALVSYYFPDKHSLMRAATCPLVGQRIEQIHAILDASTSRQDRLRQILSLLVTLNGSEANLIDHAIDVYRSDPNAAAERAALEAVYRRLRAFYNEGVAAGEWRALDPDTCLFALWGMCKSVAQASNVAWPTKIVSDESRMVGRLDALITLVQDGLRQPANPR